MCNKQWKEASVTETNSGEEEEEKKSWRARLGLDISRAFLGLHLESQSKGFGLHFKRGWEPRQGLNQGNVMILNK